MGAKISSNSLQNNDANIELENEQIYHPGDIVCGRLHLKHKDTKNQSVSIDLIGELGFRLVYDAIYPTTGANTVCFFKMSTLSIMDGEKFALSLTDQLPPAVNLAIESYPCIQYFLRVNMNNNKEHRHYIIVCPRVSIPRSLIQSLDFDAVNHKEMHLSGSIDRNWVLPGETLKITFQIKNPHHQHIKSIDGNIFMKAEFKRGECTENVMNFTVDDVGDTNEEHIAGVVSLIIPSRYLPPTFAYTNDQHHFYVNINYWIVIQTHVRDIFNKVSTTIPLSIGFERENITFDEQYHPDCHDALPYHYRK